MASNRIGFWKWFYLSIKSFTFKKLFKFIIGIITLPLFEVLIGTCMIILGVFPLIEHSKWYYISLLPVGIIVLAHAIYQAKNEDNE